MTRKHERAARADDSGLDPRWDVARWVAYVFDRPVAAPEWYWGLADGADEPGPSAELACFTRLCAAPATALEHLTDAQLNQGCWYLLGSGASALTLATHDPTIPVVRWASCVMGFIPLFAELFAPRCSPHLGHRDEPGANPLNSACYMWWDLLPLPALPEGRERAWLHNTCLDALASILALDHDACRESALHGLGHWVTHDARRVAAIIDGFLARTPGLRPELRAYALAARGGRVL